MICYCGIIFICFSQRYVKRHHLYGCKASCSALISPVTYDCLTLLLSMLWPGQYSDAISSLCFVNVIDGLVFTHNIMAVLLASIQMQFHRCVIANVIAGLVFTHNIIALLLPMLLLG